MPRVALLAVVLVSAPAAGASRIQDLVRRADMVARGQTSASLFEMEIKTRRYQRRFNIVAWEDNRGDERVLIKILGPALWRGFGTLKLGDQLKIYNPKQGHVTVVGQTMLGDSWMGSHFTNDDLVKETRLARHYAIRLRKQWQGEAPGGKATYYRATLTPKPTAPVAWGRIDYELWERGDAVVPVRAAYYRKANDHDPRRTIAFSDVKQLGGKTLPSVMTVRVANKPGEYTRIIYQQIRFDIRIPARKFTEQALRD